MMTHLLITCMQIVAWICLVSFLPVLKGHFSFDVNYVKKQQQPMRTISD